MSAVGIVIVRQIGTDDEQSKHRPPAPSPKDLKGRGRS